MQCETEILNVYIDMKLEVLWQEQKFMMYCGGMETTT